MQFAISPSLLCQFQGGYGGKIGPTHKIRVVGYQKRKNLSQSSALYSDVLWVKKGFVKKCLFAWISHKNWIKNHFQSILDIRKWLQNPIFLHFP